MKLLTKVGLIAGAFWLSMQASPRIVEINNDTDLYLHVKHSKKAQDCHVIELVKHDIAKALKRINVDLARIGSNELVPMRIEPRSKVKCDIPLPQALKYISGKSLRIHCSLKKGSNKYPFLSMHEGHQCIVINNHENTKIRNIGEMQLGMITDKPYKLTIKQADTGFIHQFINNGIQMNLIRGRYFVTTAYHPLMRSCSFVVLIEELDAREGKHVRA